MKYNNLLSGSLVMAGGGLGATARWLLQEFWPHMANDEGLTRSIVSLAVVNILGCVLIGIAVDPKLRTMRAALGHSFWVTGVLGGFTSFSAFVAVFSRVSESNSLLQAFIYAVATVVTCVGGYLSGQFVRTTLSERSNPAVPLS